MTAGTLRLEADPKDRTVWLVRESDSGSLTKHVMGLRRGFGMGDLLDALLATELVTEIDGGLRCSAAGRTIAP